MKRVFSTSDVRPYERFDYWHESLCSHLAANDSQPDFPAHFSLRMDAAALGELSLVAIATGSVTCTHAQRHLKSTDDELMLVRQARGHVSLQHNGHAVTLRAGHMTLLDPRFVYTCRHSADSEFLVVKCPRRSLVARVGAVAPFAGRELTADAGVVGLLSELLAVLPGHAEMLDVAAVQASNQVLDLLAAALSKAAGGSTPRIGSSRAMLAHQLRIAIERALSDPTANAESIARSVGISLRYANAILSDQDTSVTRLLQARRLERCGQMLADPLHKNLSISSIAYAWGFSDLTHFSRRFRRAFGVLPSEYRRSQAGK